MGISTWACCLEGADIMQKEMKQNVKQEYIVFERQDQSLIWWEFDLGNTCMGYSYRCGEVQCKDFGLE